MQDSVADDQTDFVETIRITHWLDHNNHKSLSLKGIRSTIDSPVRSFSASVLSRDLSTFQSDRMFKVFSEQQREKEFMPNLFD